MPEQVLTLDSDATDGLTRALEKVSVRDRVRERERDREREKEMEIK